MRTAIIIFALLFTPVVAAAEEHVHSLELNADPYSSESLFLTTSEWTASDGRRMKLRDLQGKARLVALFYASCTSACPAIVDAMKRVEKVIPAKHAKDFGLVLVTFDTEEDTPEALRRYAEKRDLDKERWLLLRGEEDDTRELAVLLGSKFKKLGPKNFAHSNLIALIDRDGRIVARAKTLADIESFSDDVRKFLETADGAK